MIARFLVLTLLAPRPAVQVEPEYKVKALMIKALAAGTSWPERAFAAPDSPIFIGLVGKDRFGVHLENLKGQTLKNGRKIDVVLAADAGKVGPLKSCQIVFVSDSEDEKLGDILDAFKDSPTLLIGDKEGFGRRGLGINFFVEEGADGKPHTGFEINSKVLQEKGLTVDAKVLKLGRILK